MIVYKTKPDKFVDLSQDSSWWWRWQAGHQGTSTMLKMYYVMFVRNHNEDINILTDYPERYKHAEGLLTVIIIKDVL